MAILWPHRDGQAVPRLSKQTRGRQCGLCDPVRPQEASSRTQNTGSPGPFGGQLERDSERRKMLHHCPQCGDGGRKGFSPPSSPKSGMGGPARSSGQDGEAGHLAGAEDGESPLPHSFLHTTSFLNCLSMYYLVRAKGSTLKNALGQHCALPSSD